MHRSDPKLTRSDPKLTCAARRAIAADTAIRLGRDVITAAEMWLNLQKNYDLELAEREKGEEITRTITPLTRDSGFAH